MSAEDREYYAKRERQARASAERTADTAARRAHLAMAEHYSRMLNGEPTARELTRS